MCVRDREIDCWAGVCEGGGREGERLLGVCVCVREGERLWGGCV